MLIISKTKWALNFLLPAFNSQTAVYDFGSSQDSLVGSMLDWNHTGHGFNSRQGRGFLQSKFKYATVLSLHKNVSFLTNGFSFTEVQEGLIVRRGLN